MFTRVYRTDLDQLGPARIALRMWEIADAEGDHRLVLLCFQDLAKPGLWCHRRVFAAWWKDVTGDEVRELSPMVGGHEQGTLMQGNGLSANTPAAVVPDRMAAQPGTAV